jgi:alginate O-acetyltransferase complex protein AlgI
VDFLAAIGMQRWARWRRPLLIASLVINLASLCFFKYLGFAIDQLATILDIPPGTREWSTSIILPVGISFYTFQSMSYTIDVYRGRLTPTRNPVHFLAYLAMFPQLVAGPIVRASELLPQLETPGLFNRANRLMGLRLATWGFIKKLVIADNLALTVDALFAGSDIEMSAGLAWLGAILFALQIFADFSGYSDIACGIAFWMGYRFPENFKQPYASRSFREFWSRWHVTLSTWFRDYLYIPLGGSRSTAARTSVNLLATMMISGLWHGANWTFILWGLWHGALLVAERLVSSTGIVIGRGHLRSGLGWGVTMIGVLVGWVIFRAESVGQAMRISLAMVAGSWDGHRVLEAMEPRVWLALLVAIAGAAVWGVSPRRLPGPIAGLPIPVQVPLVAAGIVFAVLLRGPGHAFIYFQF